MSASGKENMQPNNVFDELQDHRNHVSIFRRLITIAPSHDSSATEGVKEWQPVLTHILEIISSNNELGNERVLLACHAFYALLSARCDSQFFEDTVMRLQESNSSRDLRFLEKRYAVSDLELFKLLNAYGYLQTNRKDTYFNRALSTMYDVIHRNCLKYTRYSYFAYKVLHMWLKRTSETHFWRDSDIELEQKLEAVIFSNWSNALNEIPKQNAQIFNTYLRAMSTKYDGFLEHVFEVCVEKLSWQNETKYTILAEVCQLWDNVEAMTRRDFLFGLCVSLTKNSLRCGGTRLYLVILRKLNEDKWQETFGESLRFFIDSWESGEHEDHNALHSLFVYWLEPTIEAHRSVLKFLWKLYGNSQNYFLLSHLLRVAARLHVKLPEMHKFDCCMNDKEETVRLNVFAAFCYRDVVEQIEKNQINPFLKLEEFLWYNANTTTILMREGIVKYFRIFYSNILKTIRTEHVKSIRDFTNWLHEHLLDCFEIGSCYQRKILGLNLYKTLLSFTNGNLHNNCAHHKECLRNVTAIDKYLKDADSWNFTDKKSLFVLLRLVLDSALDVRQLASVLILEYFENNILSATERSILYKCAWEHCNSSKFYKIESGAILMKIIACWFPLEKDKDTAATCFDNEYNSILAFSSYSEFLLKEAQHQLTQMKRDILKAVVQNRPFYGVLTALLAIAFRAGPESWILTPQFTMNVLRFLKDAVDFFLSTLSTETSDTAYSSSFAEMGLAIDEKIKTSEIGDCDYDELQLSPAHQVLISCIWMSLKVSCEIVSEIGMLMQSDVEVRHSINIIVTVLLKCRHKGVVESAGVAIANLSRHLYNKKEYCELPRAYLTILLEEDMGKLHLTRRGAGLSIMFHKLVISDNRKNRPTAHFAVQILLRSLKNFSMAAVKNVEPGQDSPWAKRLHFLRALVADKEIHAQLSSYIENICLTCFKYMESDVWTIRNASLQLYGAVVARLVGQCSGKKGEAPDFGDGYSVNHFVTHYPTLADRVCAQLRAVSRIRGTSSTALHAYANVAHTLILLSKMWTGGCDLVDYPSQTFTETVESLLREFLVNPMIYVRQLAAKAYAALTPSAKVCLRLNAIRRDAFLSCDDNLSHGLLLTTGYLKERLINDKRNLKFLGDTINTDYTEFDSYTHLLRRYQVILKTWQNIREHKENYIFYVPCYVIETLFFQDLKSITDKVLFTNISTFNDALSTIDCIMSSQNIRPGFFQFVQLWMQLYAAHIQQTNSIEPEIVRKILDSNCVEQSVGFLNGLSPCIPLFEFSLRYLISMEDNPHQLLLDTITMFVLKTVKHVALLQTERLDFNEITEAFSNIKTFIATNSNVIHVKNMLILAFSRHETLINEVLSLVIRSSADNRQSARLIATEYLELALHRFTQLEELSNQLTIVQCCSTLLKDEFAEIRDVVSTLLQKYKLCDYTHPAPARRLQHEEILYQWLIQYFIRRIQQKKRSERLLKNMKKRLAIRRLQSNQIKPIQYTQIKPIQYQTIRSNFIRYFTRAIRNSVDSNVTIENPFYHDDTTFYREETKFLDLCFLFINFEERNNFFKCVIKVRKMIEWRFDFSYDDLQAVLYLKEIDYLMRKRDIVMCPKNCVIKYIIKQLLLN